MQSDVSQYEVLLIISGGIAAYKSAALSSQLVQAGVGVSVVMTEHACKFVCPLTFSTLTGRRVFTDMFASADIHDAEHIRLTDLADLVVVAPATANIIAKITAGICDDLASTLLCSCDSDILLAPAMNPRMWNNPATAANVAHLRQREGIHFSGPEQGRMACGTSGIGRMSEPETIFGHIISLLRMKPPKSAPSS